MNKQTRDIIILILVIAGGITAVLTAGSALSWIIVVLWGLGVLYLFARGKSKGQY